MTSKPTRIAIFEGVDTDLSPLIAGLNRFSVDLISVRSLAEAVAGAEDSVAGFVVPPRPAGGASAVTTCLQIRADETFTTVPVIALSQTRESAVIRSLYGAGADAVICAPFEPEGLYLQILALDRQRRSLDEQLQLLSRNSGLKRSMYEALNAVREGVLVFDVSGEVIFLNEPARMLLGVEDSLEPEILHRIGSQLKPSLDRFHEHTAALGPLSEGRVTVTRGDGRAMNLALRIRTIFGADESAAGTAVAISDLHPIAHLSATLAQEHRTRSLALLSAAGNLHLLALLNGKNHSILSQIEDHLTTAPRRCHISATITALLEVIDPALNPGARLKVNLATEAMVAVPVPEIFQLAGHLILHSVARGGIGGETSISTNLAGERLELHVVSELSGQIIAPGGDIIGRLLHGSWAERSAHRSIDGMSLVDFEAARTIAHKNGLTLKERPLDDARVAYIVSMPRCDN